MVELLIYNIQYGEINYLTRHSELTFLTAPKGAVVAEKSVQTPSSISEWTEVVRRGEVSTPLSQQDVPQKKLFTGKKTCETVAAAEGAAAVATTRAARTTCSRNNRSSSSYRSQNSRCSQGTTTGFIYGSEGDAVISILITEKQEGGRRGRREYIQERKES